MRVQVRPGQWTIKITSRQIGPLTTYSWQLPDDTSWPSEEIVSFLAHPDLRSVEIEGVSPIDPQLTSMPEEWRTYPAYRMLAGETMQLKETRRGAGQPPPDQLSLQRNIWLRFDGSGYTFQDSISGRKKNGWRLEMAPPFQLGRVMVNGQEQFITRRAGSDRAGVEVREGELHLTADSTYSGPVATLPPPDGISSSSMLRWYQDVSDQYLPQPWLLSIPILAYRLAMLAWALWISFTLLGLLKWGWEIASEPLLWDSTPKKKAEDKKEEITR